MEKETVRYKQGIYRPYYLTSKPLSLLSKTRLIKVDHFFIFVLLSLSVLIRLYKLPVPGAVVFDEVHFGGFAWEYFRGRFFVDVHPPLAKLIYYGIAILFGWDGQFEFERIGNHYNESVPFVQMRVFPALCGIAVVVITFQILRASYCRPLVAFFGALLVLVENSLVTQSRLILLDSPLLLGVAISIYGFRKTKIEKPFSYSWFKSTVYIGLGLGIATSTKLVGIFTIAWVVIVSLIQYYYYLGDLDVSRRSCIKHIVYRVPGMVLVPLTIYLATFAIHFSILKYNGTGSGAVSPNFRSTFVDSDDLKKRPVEVLYGSTVTIKHHNLQTYLHSHDFPYKSGSKEQQVSTYGFLQDTNNEWIIETKNVDKKLDQKLMPVKDGDIIKLRHKNTGRYLHVSDVRPPISERDYAKEVSCAGENEQQGDNNYEFKIMIASTNKHAKTNLPLIKMRATESVFQIISRGSRCSVISHLDKLPDWGFHQNEVLCIELPTIPNSLWYIDHLSHPLLDDDGSHPRIDLGHFSFWDKLVEYHRAMLRENSNILSDHAYASSPESWPFLLRGINYYSSRPDSHIYLLGNVVIYNLGILSVVILSVKLSLHLFKLLNPFQAPALLYTTSTFYENSLELVIGFLLHYFPFFHMKRQLFLHHYLPALYFSILLIAQYIEYQILRRKQFGHLIMLSILAASIFCFHHFMPIIYGTTWTRGECNTSKWFSTWDFDCMSYSH